MLKFRIAPMYVCMYACMHVYMYVCILSLNYSFEISTAQENYIRKDKNDVKVIKETHLITHFVIISYFKYLNLKYKALSLLFNCVYHFILLYVLQTSKSFGENITGLFIETNIYQLRIVIIIGYHSFIYFCLSSLLKWW